MARKSKLRVIREEGDSWPAGCRCGKLGTINNDRTHVYIAPDGHGVYAYEDVMPHGDRSVRSHIVAPDGWTETDVRARWRELARFYTPFRRVILTEGEQEAEETPAPQVGGKHYERLDPQPITVIERWQLGYHEGNVLKYLARWREKGGLEDLHKALWYLERLVAQEAARDGGAWVDAVWDEIDAKRKEGEK